MILKFENDLEMINREQPEQPLGIIYIFYGLSIYFRAYLFILGIIYIF